MNKDILVLGVGNLLLKDEGVGIHVIQALEKEGLPPNVSLMDGGTGGLHLIGWIQDYNRIIMVDATLDHNPPGTIRLIRPHYATDFPPLMSAHEIGLVKALQDGDYNYIDRAKIEPREGLMAAYDADFFLSSANAVTDDGVLVNIDGNSNRVSCIAQGPKKVIFIVGINKVCPDLDSAMKRARNVAATANAQRFDIKTPCKETGKCFNCKSPDTICCQFLITRYSRHKDRIHVILVNDTLGM